MNSFRYGRAADRGGAGERGSKGGKEEVKKAGACKSGLMKMVLLVLMLGMRMMLRRGSLVKRWTRRRTSPDLRLSLTP